MKAIVLAAAAAVLAGATPGAARTPVAVAAFDSLELQGGGRVTVRHGAAQSVTLVRGNSCQSLGECGVLQTRKSVLLIPNSGEGRLLWEQGHVLDLRAVKDHRVRSISGPVISLQQPGNRFAGRLKTRGHPEQAGPLMIVSRIPDQDAAAIGTYPPKRALFMQPVVEQERRAIRVAGGHELFNARGAQDGGVRP